MTENACVLARQRYNFYVNFAFTRKKKLSSKPVRGARRLQTCQSTLQPMHARSEY